MYKLIFLDTETTGLSKTDRLCQLAYKIEDVIVNELFLPPVPMNIEAESVHHISQKELNEKPAFIGSHQHEVLKKLLADPNYILVAHNAQFDINMLTKEGLTVPKYICTKKLAQYLLSDNPAVTKYNLQYLRTFFQVELENIRAHDAEGDVLVLEAVFNKLMSIATDAATVKAKEKGKRAPSDKKIIERILELSMHPVQPKQRMAFGKYKGMMLTDAIKADRGYFTWLISQKGDDDDELMRTVKHLLNTL